MSRARLGRVFPLEAAVKLYASLEPFYSLDAIAKILGYTKDTIRRHLVAAGTQMRPKGGKRFGKRKTYQPRRSKAYYAEVRAGRET